MTRVLLAIFLFCPSLAFADNRFAEITAFGAYRFGGTFEEDESDASYELNDSPSFGLILNFRHKDPTQWEIFYSQQRTEAVPGIRAARAGEPAAGQVQHLDGAVVLRPYGSRETGSGKFQEEGDGVLFGEATVVLRGGGHVFSGAAGRRPTAAAL